MSAAAHPSFKGVEFAGQLIGYAAPLLVPYVASCPACLDNLFSVIANSALSDLHAKLGDDRYNFTVMRTGDGSGDQAPVTAHLEAMQPLIRSMLETADSGSGHQH